MTCHEIFPNRTMPCPHLRQRAIGSKQKRYRALLANGSGGLPKRNSLHPDRVIKIVPLSSLPFALGHYHDTKRLSGQLFFCLALSRIPRQRELSSPGGRYVDHALVLNCGPTYRPRARCRCSHRPLGKRTGMVLGFSGVCNRLDQPRL